MCGDNELSDDARTNNDMDLGRTESQKKKKLTWIGHQPPEEAL
jgi:hypothetical protein